ncbi:Ig-like domain-containing protein [Anatilimnocola sp. NA78]|uniref:tandem-95 repeat protein n=1 Tax=Anatilimnocola sp. NA78 TaxID=3415683 RepID=UPI003CE56230
MQPAPSDRNRDPAPRAGKLASRKRRRVNQEATRRHFLARFECLEDRRMMAINFLEDFNTYAAAGFHHTPGVGQLDSDVWTASGFSNAMFNVTPGSVKTTGQPARGLRDEFYDANGGFYTFDAAAGNRFFAINPSAGEWTPGDLTLRVYNDNVAVQDPTISFDYWVRDNSVVGTSMSLSYQIDEDANWISVPSLDYNTPSGAGNFNFVLATTKSITLTGVTIPSGASLDLRWSNSESSATPGLRDAIGIDNIRVTTAAPNVAPTISAIADQSTLSYTPKLVNFTVGDTETAAGLLNVSATSSNPAVLPSANIVFSGSGANRTLTATPVAGTGTTTVTVTVTDAGGKTATEDFLLTVDQAWTLSMPQNLTAAQGQLDVVEIPVVLNSNGTPAATLYSMDLAITYDTNVMDIEGVTLGSALTPAPLMASLNPNLSEPGKIGLLVNVVGGLSTATNGQVVVIRARMKQTAPTGTTRINLQNSYVPSAGLPIVTQLNEGLLPLGPPPTNADSDALADAAINIFANNQPSLAGISSQTVDEDSTPPAVPLTGISTGGETQQVAFITSITNLAGTPDTSVVASAAVSYTSPSSTGTLNYTLTPAASGTAIVKVLMRDAGPDGVLLTSDDGFAQRQFTVTVNAVNDLPTLTPVAGPTISEDALTQLINLTGITAGDSESQALTLTAVSSNPSLIPDPLLPYASPSNTATLSYTPVANQSGTAKINVTVRDAGFDGVAGNSDDATSFHEFTITVNPVNDLPTLAAISDVTVDEDAATKTISLSGITAGPLETQDLSITVISDNTDLIPTPTLLPYTSPSSTASIQFTPVANKSGTAKIKVTVRDTGLDGIPGNSDDGSTEQEFTVTVNAQNDLPTLDSLAPLTIDEDALAQTINLSGITAGGGESQNLTVTAVSDNPGLIPSPSVPYSSPSSTASFSITPVANQSGTAKITVTVRDAGLDGIAGNADDGSFSRELTVNVTAVNDTPTLDAITAKTIDEDVLTQTVNLAGITAGGGETQNLKITAVSDNTGLIPNPGVVYSSPSNTAVLSYAPAANKSGSAKITVTVRDAGADGLFDTPDDATFDQHFTVTVNPINDAPTLASIDPVIVAEDSGTKTVALTGITAGQFEGQLLSVTAVSDNAALTGTPTILPYTSPSSTASLQFTPVADQSGTAKITVTVRDAGFDGILNTADDATFDQQLFVTVTAANDTPTLTAIVPATTSINEDTSTQTVNLSGITAGGGETQNLTVTATSDNPGLVPDPSIPYSSPSSTAVLSYAPVANKSGSAKITVTVRDAGLDGIAGNGDDATFSQHFDVTVNPVNDAPTLIAISDVTIAEDATTQAVALSGITAGALETQTLSLTVVSDNTDLIPTPTLLPYTSPSSTASLQFTPAANKSGTAKITVTVHDAGLDGIAGNGDDGTFSQHFMVNVTPANDLPTLDSIAPLTIDEDALAQTINLSGITAGGGESQNLTVTAVSDNPGLIPSPSVTYSSPNSTASFSITPVANQSGTAKLTVTVRDAGLDGIAGNADDGSFSRELTVNVTAVNDTPTLDAITAKTIDEDTLTQTVNLAGITAGGGETQNLKVTAVSDNTGLISNPGVVYSSPSSTAALSYAPAANKSGSAKITVSVRDAGADGLFDTADDATFDQHFTVTVNPINDAPTLDTIAPLSVAEDSGTKTVALTGITAGQFESQLLSVTAVSDNAALTGIPTLLPYTSPSSTASLQFTPVADQSGTAKITVTVRDAGFDGILNTADDATFDQHLFVTVTAANDTPTLAAIIPAVVSINEDAATQTVNLSGITAGGSESQNLTVTATSDNPGLIPDPSVPYTSPSGTAVLSYSPVANKSGSAKITVTVRDAGLDGIAGNIDDATFSQHFDVTVNPVNDAPTLAAISDVTIAEDATTQTVALAGITAGPLETQTLSLTVVSDNTDLIPTPTLLPYTSPSSTASIQFTPTANKSGSAKITVTVRDTGLDGIPGNTDDGSTEQEFTVTVNAQNDLPTLDSLAPLTIDEDALAQTINLSGITAGGGESQNLTVTAVSDNPGLVPSPTVPYSSPGSTASFSITPIANQSGTAKITVTVRDAGLDGIAGNGDDGSFSRDLTVNVTAVNDAPTLDPIASKTIDEDAPTQTVNLAGITAGGGETQNLKVTAVSDNADLIPNPSIPYTSPSSTATLSYAPAANKSGSAKITVTVRDAGADGLFVTPDDATFDQHFMVTVNPINDAPTLDTVASVSVAEDSETKTVALTGITAGQFESQLLSVTAVSDNAALTGTPTILPYTSPSSTATLQFTPVAAQSGTAKITVTVRDAGFDGILNTADDATFDQQLFVTVTAANDTPTLAAILPAIVSINEDAATQTVNLSGITAGGGETQNLTVIATSDNPGLIPDPSVPYTSPSSTAVLSYSPVANKSGSAKITVTVRDAGLDGIAGNGDDATFSQHFDVTVNPVNDAPSLIAISDVTIAEDAITQTVALSGITAGPLETQDLSITVVSDNADLIPTPTLLPYTSPSSTASLQFTPAANKSGTAKITVTVHDAGLDGIAGNGDDGTFSQHFTVTVNAVNDAPSFTKGADQAVLEDAAAQSVGNWATAILSGPNENDSVNFVITSNDRPDLFAVGPSIAANGTLTYTPALNANGTATIRVKLVDNGPVGGVNESAEQTFTISLTAVNDAPSFTKGADPTAFFNAGQQTLPAWATNISAGALNEGGQTLTFTVTVLTNPGLFAVAPAIASNGTLTFTTATGQSGSATISVFLKDDAGIANGGSDTSATQTFTINVSPQAANIPPTINTIAPQTINEDAGSQTVNFSGVTTGGETQTLKITAASSHPTLIPDPVVTYISANPTGSLAYSPNANANGTATITVTVRDAGHDGIMDNADDGVTLTSFLVTVNAVNDAPSFTKGADVSVLEDAAPQSTNWATLISSGPNEADAVTFNIRTNSRPELFAAGPTISSTGVLTFTPAPNAHGTATIALDLSDNGGTDLGGANTSATQTFTITLTPVNDAPSFAKGADQTVLEDAVPQTVANWATNILSGPLENDAVSFTVSGNDRPDLFSAGPSIGPDGTLSYTPAPNAHGSATIRVKAIDNGGTANSGVNESAEQTFVINLTPVNDPPSFTKGPDQSVLEDAGPQTVINWVLAMSPGPNEAGSAVNFTVESNDNPGLFAVAPAVSPAGVLTYTLAANVHGSATIGLRINDDGGIANSGVNQSAIQTFVINVTNVNDAPSFTKGADQTVLEDVGAQTVANWATAISAGTNESEGVAFVVTGNSRPDMFASQPAIAPNGTLTYTPAANAYGSATITIKLTDLGGTANLGVNESAEQTFVINLTPVNDAPSFTKGPDQSVLEDAGPQTVTNWVLAMSPGPNEAGSAVNFTIESNDNPALFAVAPAVSPAGALTYTLAANAYGSATIGLRINDDGGITNSGVNQSAIQTFVINVTNVNDAPSFVKGADQTVLEDVGAQTVANWATAISAGTNESEGVAFVVTGNSRPDLFALQLAIAPNGTLTYTPATNAHGTATITVKLADLGGTANSGINESTEQTFVINLTPVNDAPSFTKGLDQAVLEDAGPQSIPLWATDISAGINETGTVGFVIESNSNSPLFAVPPAISESGTLTYTTTANASGTATIVVRVTDLGGTDNGGVNTSATQSFVITVNPTNDAPTIAPVSNLTVVENAGPQTVLLSGITAGGGETQSLRVTASSSNAGLIPSPSVTYTLPDSSASLTFASEFDQIGTSVIMVTVRDWGLNGIWDDADDGLTTTNFTVEVIRANRAPVASDSSLNTPFDTAVSGQLQVNDADGPSLTYTLLMSPVSGTLTSLNTATGAFTYQPNAGFTGVDVFTFRVSDGEFSDTATVRIVTQAPVATVQVIQGVLLADGTPREDTFLISRVSPSSVLVRTGTDSTIYPLLEGFPNHLSIRTGDANDYVVLRGITNLANIDLGAGDDIALTGAGEDHITGGLGNDIVAAGDGNNIVRGDETDVDALLGGNDVITGGNDRDVVYGGGGNDRIMGYAGDNYLRGNAGDDVIFGGDGPDFILGGSGNDAIYGGLGDDVIAGNDGNDTLSGSSGDDMLIGGFGSDQLFGEENRDLLIGGEITTTNEAFTTELLQMLATWVASHPGNLATSVLSPDDAAVDTLFGASGDDDFYRGTGDLTPDYRFSPEHGNDRRFP